MSFSREKGFRGGFQMRRQALYRISWEDDGTAQRPPAVIPIRSVGPWEPGTDGELLYEGPLGQTSIEVKVVVDDPAAEEGP